MNSSDVIKLSVAVSTVRVYLHSESKIRCGKNTFTPMARGDYLTVNIQALTKSVSARGKLFVLEV